MLFKVFCAVVCFTFVRSDLINEEVTRVIDLQSHLVKVTTTILLRNDGSPESTFRYTVDPSHAKHLAHIQFYKVN